MATTTLRYLSYPAAAVGISLATGGGAAWAFSGYTQLVPVTTITSTFNIAGVSLMPPVATGSGVTNEYLVEIATGLTSAEVLILQVPFTVRNVSAAGYLAPIYIPLPEPKVVAANTRLSARVAYSVTTTVSTITGLKIVYQMV